MNHKLTSEQSLVGSVRDQNLFVGFNFVADVEKFGVQVGDGRYQTGMTLNNKGKLNHMIVGRFIYFTADLVVIPRSLVK